MELTFSNTLLIKKKNLPSLCDSMDTKKVILCYQSLNGKGIMTEEFQMFFPGIMTYFVDSCLSYIINVIYLILCI